MVMRMIIAVDVVMVMPMLVLMIMMIVVIRLLRLPINDNIDFAGGNATAINTRDPQLGAHIQGSDGSTHQVCADARIQQCAQHHVSADSRKTLEISNAHRNFVISVIG